MFAGTPRAADIRYAVIQTIANIARQDPPPVEAGINRTLVALFALEVLERLDVGTYFDAPSQVEITL